LVVEENPQQRSVMDESLRSVGHEVLSVGSGQEGMEALEGGSIEIVILDMLITDFPSIQLIRDVEKRGLGQNALIAITDNGQCLTSDFVLEIARIYGVKQMLAKPFPMKKLHNCIDIATPSLSHA
jgi:CheY-like chemotaxis protein